MRGLLAIAAASLAAGGWGCSLRQSFRCEVDDNCLVQEAGQGFCEPSGYCSFNDPECDTGRRYGEFAAPELAETCVDPMDGSGTEAASGTEAESSGAPTTLELDSSSGTESTGSPPIEICDDVDNDGDGLIDEFSPLNDTCEGCALHEVDGFPLWVCDAPTGTWGGARQWCMEQFGALPARLDTPALREAGLTYATEVVGEPGYWIGGHLDAGEWVWPNGELIDEKFWDAADGQPDGNEDEDCILVGPEGWRDGFCGTDDLPVICGEP